MLLLRAVSSSLQTAARASQNCAAPMEGSSLVRARQLAAELPDPQNTSQTDGEHDMHEWWERHEPLFADARREWGRKHPALYEIGDASVERFVNPALVRAVAACEAAAARGEEIDERPLLALFTEAGAPGVWRFPLFTPAFCTLLLEELEHHEASGIPLRRPNGMNRYGAILDELGLEASLAYLARRFLRPLGQLLYPHLIAAHDADHHYGFVVRYKVGEDVALAEHADASVLTLNANLGVPGFTGGSLGFKGTRWVDANPQSMPESTVDFSDFTPGEAILHLGGQYHSARPIESGERANLIVWLHGPHEVVRFAAHDEADRLTAAQRWSAFAEERAASKLFGRSVLEKSEL